MLHRMRCQGCWWQGDSSFPKPGCQTRLEGRRHTSVYLRFLHPHSPGPWKTDVLWRHLKFLFLFFLQLHISARHVLIKNAADDFGSFSHSLWWLILMANLTTFVTNENPSCWVFLWGASLIRVFRAERPCLNLFSAHMKGSKRSFCSLPIVLNSCWQVHLPCCGSCAAGMKSNFFRIPT